MGSSRRFAFLAINAMAGLAGVSAIVAIVRWMDDERPKSQARLSQNDQTTVSPSATNRWAFVAPGVFSARNWPDSAPISTSSIAREPEITEAWSTETRPQATPPPSAPGFTLLPPLRLPWQSARPAAPKQLYTVKSRLAEIAPAAGARLTARFEAAKASWPPAEIALIAIKDQKSLELHARPSSGPWTLIHRYRVLAASGGAGPKLRQGDRQVPEGVYGIVFLNPNSAFHVSLRVNYPNAFDRQMAASDGRKDLGGDIMIHGRNLSAGCLAIGDEAVEELFVLAAQTGLANVRLVIAPTDLRERAAQLPVNGHPAWVGQLYTELAVAMAPFKAPPSPGLLSFFMR